MDSAALTAVQESGVTDPLQAAAFALGFAAGGRYVFFYSRPKKTAVLPCCRAASHHAVSACNHARSASVSTSTHHLLLLSAEGMHRNTGEYFLSSVFYVLRRVPASTVRVGFTKHMFCVDRVACY